MKNFLIVLILLFAATAPAQEVIDFMGIPIDGTKADVLAKLKEKGFRETDNPNTLEGMLDDIPVEAIVLENTRVNVYGIELRHEMGCDEAEAIERYNSLLLKFRNDPKYNDGFSELIPEGEPIAQRLRSDTNVYTAYFTQAGSHGYVHVKLRKTNNWKDEERYQKAHFVIYIEYSNANNSPRG